MVEEKIIEGEQSTNESSEKKTEEKSTEEIFYNEDGTVKEAEKKEEKKVEETEDEKVAREEKEAKDTKDAADAAIKEKAVDDKNKKKDGVPEKYDVKLADDSLISDERKEKIESFAKDRGFSNEHAQSLVNEVVNEAVEEAVTLYQEATLENAKELADVTWPQQCKDDKEIGGDDYAKNAELSKRAREATSSPEFNKILLETGYGNHPEVVRHFLRLGKMMSDDQLVLGGGKGPIKEKDAADVFYGEGTIENEGAGAVEE